MTGTDKEYKAVIRPYFVKLLFILLPSIMLYTVVEANNIKEPNSADLSRDLVLAELALIMILIAAESILNIEKLKKIGRSWKSILLGLNIAGLLIVGVFYGVLRANENSKSHSSNKPQDTVVETVAEKNESNEKDNILTPSEGKIDNSNESTDSSNAENSSITFELNFVSITEIFLFLLSLFVIISLYLENRSSLKKTQKENKPTILGGNLKNPNVELEE